MDEGEEKEMATTPVYMLIKVSRDELGCRIN
jgi:hypothetical protein